MHCKDNLKIYDCLGNRLYNGDDVLVTKGLKIKGTQKKLKKGEKLKNIRLNEGLFSIRCHIDGIGIIEMKAESLKRLR